MATDSKRGTTEALGESDKRREKNRQLMDVTVKETEEHVSTGNSLEKGQFSETTDETLAALDAGLSGGRDVLLKQDGARTEDVTRPAEKLEAEMEDKSRKLEGNKARLESTAAGITTGEIKSETMKAASVSDEGARFAKDAKEKQKGTREQSANDAEQHKQRSQNLSIQK